MINQWNSLYLDSAYIISRFCEEYEKNVFDSYADKVIFSGFTPSIEERHSFEVVKKKVFSMIESFYHGDEQSGLEKEIEKAYLSLKARTWNEMMFVKCNNQKTKIDVYLTESEANKQKGIKNFRVNDLDYMELTRADFDERRPEDIFNSLYYIRKSDLTRKSYFKRLYSSVKLNILYRKSLIRLGSQNRISLSSAYIFSQITYYIQSKEFLSEFKMNLNYRLSFNLVIVLIWLVSNRLSLINESQINKACDVLRQDLIDHLYEYARTTVFKYEKLRSKGNRIKDYKEYIKRVFLNLDFIFNTKKNHDFTHNPDKRYENEEKEKKELIKNLRPLLLSVYINDLFDLNRSNEIIELYEIYDNPVYSHLSFIKPDMKIQEKVDIQDIIDNNPSLILYKNQILTHLTEFILSLYESLNKKDYFQIENGGIQMNIDYMRLPILYNHQFLYCNDYFKSIGYSHVSDYNKFILSVLDFYNLLPMNKNIDLITKSVTLPYKDINLLDEITIDEKNGNVPFLMKLKIKFRNIFLINWYEQEEEIANELEKVEKEKNIGKELQNRKKDVGLGLNELVVYQGYEKNRSRV